MSSLKKSLTLFLLYGARAQAVGLLESDLEEPSSSPPLARDYSEITTLPGTNIQEHSSIYDLPLFGKRDPEFIILTHEYTETRTNYATATLTDYGTLTPTHTTQTLGLPTSESARPSDMSTDVGALPTLTDGSTETASEPLILFTITHKFTSTVTHYGTTTSTAYRTETLTWHSAVTSTIPEGSTHQAPTIGLTSQKPSSTAHYPSSSDPVRSIMSTKHARSTSKSFETPATQESNKQMGAKTTSFLSSSRAQQEKSLSVSGCANSKSSIHTASVGPKSITSNCFSHSRPLSRTVQGDLATESNAHSVTSKIDRVSETNSESNSSRNTKSKKVWRTASASMSTVTSGYAGSYSGTSPTKTLLTASSRPNSRIETSSSTKFGSRVDTRKLIASVSGSPKSLEHDQHIMSSSSGLRNSSPMRASDSHFANSNVRASQTLYRASAVNAENKATSHPTSKASINKGGSSPTDGVKSEVTGATNPERTPKPNTVWNPAAGTDMKSAIFYPNQTMKTSQAPSTSARDSSHASSFIAVNTEAARSASIMKSVGHKADRTTSRALKIGTATSQIAMNVRSESPTYKGSSQPVVTENAATGKHDLQGGRSSAEENTSGALTTATSLRSGQFGSEKHSQSGGGIDSTTSIGAVQSSAALLSTSRPSTDRRIRSTNMGFSNGDVAPGSTSSHTAIKSHGKTLATETHTSNTFSDGNNRSSKTDHPGIAATSYADTRPTEARSSTGPITTSEKMGGSHASPSTMSGATSDVLNSAQKNGGRSETSSAYTSSDTSAISGRSTATYSTRPVTTTRSERRPTSSIASMGPNYIPMPNEARVPIPAGVVMALAIIAAM